MPDLPFYELIALLGRERIGMIAWGGIWPSLSPRECEAIEHIVKSAVRDHLEMSNHCAFLIYRLFLALYIAGKMPAPPNVRMSALHRK